MKLRFSPVLLAAMLVVSCVQAGPQPAAPKRSTGIGHLACGGSSLTAETVYLDVPDQEMQRPSQRITLRRPGSNVSIVLPHDGRLFRQPFLKNTPVLDAVVSGWTCLTAADGKAYIYVSYTCMESDLRPDCAGTSREWMRLFDPQGKELNAGFPRDAGPRTSALMKRLGLGRYEDEGVSLQGIDDSANP
ncbi:hypothetical protein [Dyella nitratireducens]|uniref:CNP1-like uncharacterized domain-containing protein n=1 Tax=Dyella nitratireducens TaxID=1849580 RepID=A0ABQ1G7N9_9GAMM|nr:hypothetical protein [Dyella nitratireducens]GGA38387.1 hypothetical protein GCM10010981_29480 [Dyella nitratireducens]GLQ40305.1 hypothetical protein GCM10007902_01540 [Dyella nitratireducens]